MTPRCGAAALGALAPTAALGHGTEVHGFADLRHAYTLDPLVLVPMVLIGTAYTIGVTRLWRQAGYGRGVPVWRVAAFGGGMLALVLALVWPLDALAGAALSAHMAQHVMMTAVAAPLLAGSAPLVTSLWALPLSWRRRLGAAARGPVLRGGRTTLTLPLFAWCFYAAMLWIWHMPGPYQAAVLNDALHTLEHVAFLAGALLLWWTAWLSARSPGLGLGSGVFLLFTTGMQEGLLGALFTFSNQTVYPIYDSAPGLWNVTPLEDQQLAGILMWIPGGMVYLCGGLVLTYLWLSELERSAEKRYDRAAPPRAAVSRSLGDDI